MKNWLNKLFGARDNRAASTVTPASTPLPTQQPPQQPLRQSTKSQTIVIVSGLPRSGTSMMMKMLEAGGLPVIIDGLRAADKDNPEGYYELERVKELDKGDTAWVGEAQGKGVKVISALLEHLPAAYNYRVIFMHRRIEEILRSQRKMLEHRGEATDAVSDAEIADLFAKHVTKVLTWARSRPNFVVLEVDYNAMLQDPLPYVQSINQFLDNKLDARAMSEIINPDLYRNRA